MTKKIRVYLLILVAAVCAACALAAGCKIGRPGREEILAGYNTSVVYYSNGGAFDDSVPVAEFYFKNDPESANYSEDGVPFFDISDSTSMKVERTGWDLLGWYLPATYPEGDKHAGEVMYTYTYTDAEGKEQTVPVYPVVNENGTPIKDKQSARPVFAREGVDEQILEANVMVVPSDTEPLTNAYKIADGTHMVVCAQWKRSLRVIYKLACKPGEKFTDANGKEYVHGDEIFSAVFGKGNTFMPQSSAPFKFTNASFVRSYMDETLETDIKPIPRPVAEEEGKDPESPVVWSRYISGEGWTVVSTPSDVTRMFGGIITKNKYYILNDIDCSDLAAISLKVNSSVTANASIECEGGAKTISNLKFTADRVAADANISIFGHLSKDFKVKGLTLSGVTVNVGTRGSAYFYALWNGVDEELAADALDLKVENLTANVEVGRPLNPANPNFIYNAQNGDVNNWLFGYNNSDAAFKEKYTGVVVTGESLTVTNL